MNTYLVIGTSAAGLAAARSLRIADKQAKIICITGEHELPYNRCLLADLLAGEIDRPRVYTRGQDFFKDYDITLLMGDRVESLDAENQVIALASGQLYSYDKLFLGTGKSPASPLIEGLSQFQGVFSFFDLSDVDAILSYAQRHAGNRVLVIGAGMTGLECADALQRRGFQVMLIERSNVIAGGLFDTQGSHFLKKKLEEQGIAIRCSIGLSKVVGQDNIFSGIMTYDGQLLAGDILVVTAGSRVNNHLARQAGLTMLSDYVVVDEYQQTSNPTIFAGGDICVVPHLVTHHLVPSTLWADAAMQGAVAGQNMIEKKRVYPGILPMISSTLAGLPLLFYRSLNDNPECFWLVRSGDDYHHAFLIDSLGVLYGFVMIGRVISRSSLRKALLERTPLFNNDISSLPV